MSFDFNILNEFTGKIFSTSKKQEALCNEVFVLDCEKGKFILKIANGDLRQKQLEKEYCLINELKNFIYVPAIVVYQKKVGQSFFLMEFIEGNKPSLFTDENLRIIAESLKNIHSLKNTNENVDFNKLLYIAEQNMINGIIDLNEFNNNGKLTQPQEIFNYLKNNQPKVKGCLLHGDYRPKNMLLTHKGLCVLDWGLSFIGDPYYDIAIFKWYLTQDEFLKFVKYYGIDCIDEQRLFYNEWLSAFLNV